MVQNEIDAIRALLSAKPRPVGWAERRARIEEVGSVWPVADDVELTAVDAGGVPGEWSTVSGSDRSRVLLFFHGGGYCSGSIRSHRRLVTEAGRAAAARTLAIAYRLAPEHPYPAALDDALAAWRFLRRQGIAARHVAVGGDSAGGGLTVALISALRGAGEEIPGCAWLISPWIDLTMSGATLATKDAVDPLIHKAYLEELAAAYVPAGMERKDPRVSPIYSDLQGFPPHTHSSRLGGDLAGGRHAFCRSRRQRRCRRDFGDLAAHDLCMADVERASAGRPRRTHRRRCIHPQSSIMASRQKGGGWP